MVSETFAPYLKLFLPIIKGMHTLLGERSEFILHDLSNPENSMVAIEGNVTDRQLGASVTNIVIEALAKYGDTAPEMIGYSSITKDGRPLKSSTIFIRNEKGRIVGCMCSNMDMTEFLVAQNLLESICTYGQNNSKNTEVFALDIREVVEDLIQKQISAAGKPVPMMSRFEKIQLVRELENKCVFEVKGSVELAAHSLGVSSFTVYGYLKEIRSEKVV